MKIQSVAIVTGASQGIGRATALRLARDFSAVVLAARNEDELQKIAAAVNAAGAESLVCALDLREPHAAEVLVKSTLDRFGRIDALLNIAGAVPQIDLFEMTDAQWDDGMALKLHGARRLTVLAWDALKASNGSVVLISGSAALDPKPEFAAVAAVNAAIIALAKAFAEQGIRDGVQVNSVVPGAVMTGRRQSFFEKWAPAHNLTVEEAMKRFPDEVGISRFGRPEEIADLMAYLVSAAAKWMTGASIRMDGGETKGIYSTIYEGEQFTWIFEDSQKTTTSSFLVAAHVEALELDVVPEHLIVLRGGYVLGWSSLRQCADSAVSIRRRA